jgi:hypothetical protein
MLMLRFNIRFKGKYNRKILVKVSNLIIKANIHGYISIYDQV